jgi:predicted glycosyltransferase
VPKGSVNAREPSKNTSLSREANKMSLWIDLDNSPHVHFFAPIIRNLERDGIQYFVTVRSFSQTEELARSYGLKFETIGTHSARTHFITRAAETAARACQLASYVCRRKPTAAVSHGSRALLLASWGLHIPVMTLYDYEFVFSRLANCVSQKVMVPSQVPTERLVEKGLRLEKLIPYPGFKEEVYIYDFHPEPAILSRLNLDPRRLIVTVRPPHTLAHYQSQHTEVLFDALIRRLRREHQAQVLMLCRTAEQREALRTKYDLDSAPFQLLSKAIDGLSLLWYSDMIFSGGGTMVREAALLGLNAFSIFAGKLGAADAALERQGRLKMIREVQEIESLELRKRRDPPQPTRTTETRDFIYEQITRFALQNESRASSKLVKYRGPARISQL